MPSPNDLIIFQTEGGEPWAAFIWGEADPQKVAALITLEAVEEATGDDEQAILDSCSWPPNIKPHWLRLLDDGECYEFCAETDEGAQRITGHRFYPQG